MAKDLAIILNNGSVNSAVATAMAVQKFRPILIYIDTSAHAGSRARAAYDLQVAHFKPYREHSVAMPHLAGIGTDPSAASAMAADPRHASLLGQQLTQLLPLVSTATRFAAHYQAAAVYFGLRLGPHGDDLAQATEYVQIWNELLQLPCGQADLELNTPLLELEPWQVIDVGFQVGAPFERTWSCQEDTPEPCWACRACRAREAAFQQSAKPDPLRVVKKV